MGNFFSKSALTQSSERSVRLQGRFFHSDLPDLPLARLQLVFPCSRLNLAKGMPVTLTGVCFSLILSRHTLKTRNRHFALEINKEGSSFYPPLPNKLNRRNFHFLFTPSLFFFLLFLKIYIYFRFVSCFYVLYIYILSKGRERCIRIGADCLALNVDSISPPPPPPQLIDTLQNSFGADGDGATEIAASSVMAAFGSYRRPTFLDANVWQAFCRSAGDSWRALADSHERCDDNSMLTA